MTTESDAPLLPTRKERVWLRLAMVSLSVLFLVVGGLMTWLQIEAKKEDQAKAAMLMDPGSADPGVTAPERTSTDNATQVQVGLYLERIPEMSIKGAMWTAVFDLWFRWKGALDDPGQRFVLMEGSIESKEKLTENHVGDEHYVRYRVVAKLTKSFRITRFPVDEHLLILALESGDTVRERLVFVPDTESTRISSRVSVSGYVLGTPTGIEKAHSYKTTRGDPRLPKGTKSTFSQFRFGIPIQRDGLGLYIKMFNALFVAVLVAMLACFIKPTDVDPRFGLGVGALFAAVANSYLASSYVPDTGDFALADVVNLIGVMTILVSIIESTMSLHLFSRCGKEQLSRQLDLLSFSIMLPCFLGANLLLVLAASP